VQEPGSPQWVRKRAGRPAPDATFVKVHFMLARFQRARSHGLAGRSWHGAGVEDGHVDQDESENDDSDGGDPSNKV
jgi:hypothetical protein